MTLQEQQMPNKSKVIRIKDKYRISLKQSMKVEEPSQKLNQKQKSTMLRYISKDYAYDLSHYMDKRAIKFETQLGVQGNGWNVLHFSAKLNALECIEFILKEFYNQYPDDYQNFINTKTREGYSPLMVAILYEANDALDILMKFGAANFGSDHNGSKISAYDFAINVKNQKAIRLLMSYEQLSKKQKQLNQKKLQEPIIFSKRQEGCCYRSFMTMFDFLSFGFSRNLAIEEPKNSSSNLQRSSFLNFEKISGQVKISRQISQQAQYEVQWRQITSIISNLRYPLYENYNPFDISQKNIVLKNNLILLQCLSSHPWLIRKIVQIDRAKSNHYNVNLFLNYEQKKININNLIPFLKNRQQPMFIQNQNQMWPMLLQKGLAQAHGSYFDLNQINTTLLVQQMTGFPTFQIYLDNYENSHIFSLLKQIHRKGYLYFFQGKETSNLSRQGKKDCFSILQFFEKNEKKLILVNCPFVDKAWKQKQKYEMHSLKLIKSHFNNHDQMCVWIQMDRLKQYFSKIVVSTILPNHQRKNLKAKIKDDLFFTFKVNRERQQKIVLQLINLDTKQSVPFQEIKAYRNEGSSLVKFEKGIEGQSFVSGVFSTQNTVGDYMCYISIQKEVENVFSEENIAQSIINSEVQKKHEKHMLIMWSVDGIEPIYLDENLGPVDFLRCMLMDSIKNWSQTQLYRLQTISDYALIIVKDKQTSSNIFLQMEINKNDLIEGKLISQKKISLTRYEDQDPYFQTFFFCIIRNASKYHLQRKSSYIKSPQNLGPAGQSSIGPKLNFSNKLN